MVLRTQNSCNLEKSKNIVPPGLRYTNNCFGNAASRQWLMAFSTDTPSFGTPSLTGPDRFLRVFKLVETPPGMLSVVKVQCWGKEKDPECPWRQHQSLLERKTKKKKKSLRLNQKEPPICVLRRESKTWLEKGCQSYRFCSLAQRTAIPIMPCCGDGCGRQWWLKREPSCCRAPTLCFEQKRRVISRLASKRDEELMITFQSQRSMSMYST